MNGGDSDCFSASDWIDSEFSSVFSVRATALLKNIIPCTKMVKKKKLRVTYHVRENVFLSFGIVELSEKMLSLHKAVYRKTK